MALAKICDRCGKVYKIKKDPQNNKYIVFDAESDNDHFPVNRYNGRDIGEAVDLCDECNVSLVDWFGRIGNDPF